MVRLRVGILLIILSWLPFAQVFIAIAHSNNHLTSQESATTFRLIVWGIQIIIGFIGLWLAGKIAVIEARKDGWRHTPRHLWGLFWNNQQ